MQIFMNIYGNTTSFFVVYSSGLLKNNFRYVLFLIVNVVGGVRSGIEHGVGQSAGEFAVLQLSFLILLYFGGKF